MKRLLRLFCSLIVPPIASDVVDVYGIVYDYHGYSKSVSATLVGRGLTLDAHVGLGNTAMSGLFHRHLVLGCG